MNRTSIAGLLLGFALVLDASAVRLDDSISPRQRVDVRSRWMYEGEDLSNPQRLNALAAEIRDLEIRLNTSAHVGKSGRIFLVVPDFVQGLRATPGMRVSWKARRTFRSGSVAPGGRGLLYEGPISEPVTGDVLDITIEMDARDADSLVRFKPVFEFDENR